MNVGVRLFIFGLLFLAACQQKAVYEPQALPPVPTPVEDTYVPGEPIYETVEETSTLTPAEPASEKREAMFDTKDQKVISEADILCDITDGTLTFTFRNLDSRSWQLDNSVPPKPSIDLVGIYVMVNNYAVNQHQKYLIDGVRQFGPGETFDENCGGVEILKPGEEVTCTLKPVPLRSKFYFGGVNEIFINVPGSEEDGRIEFTCA